MALIIADRLTKTFPGETRPAVDRVSFEIKQGEFVVLLGPSGCGKTTLLKMINRLYEPTDGRLLIDGVDARSMPATELRRRIGYVIQQTGLFPHLTIEQNIAVVPQLLKWDRRRIEARIDQLLDLVELPRSYRKRHPRQLSGGEQQRVGLARALAADPALMLMDEPFGALDAITRARLQDELLRIQQRLHKTILFVTHDVDEALRLADRLLIMRAGRIVQFDTPLAVLAEPADDFVRDLLDTDDVLRRLSLLTVADALAGNGDGERRAANGAPETLKPGDTLREALIRVLRSGGQALPVVANGQNMGQISSDTIASALTRTTHALPD
ncbi:ABC transporter ATP-binding protein [Roseiflexus sp.]|uniref:ABC transporter ATP-binding protein n=1 Tax=Roseiflexus sp. TaxID=2562120 RepID=UPI00398A835F